MKTATLGLTTEQANQLYNTVGSNAFETHHKRHAVVTFILLFNNPIAIILIVSAILSGFFGNVISCVIITVMMFLSVSLDFINTYRSEKAAEALKNRVKVTAQVLRDNKIQIIGLSHLVPGDVVLLSAGKIVPADGVMIESNSLYINEAALTGESFPQIKPPGSKVFLGSAAMTGEGKMQVTATGQRSAYAKVAQALTAQVRPTEYQRELTDFSNLVIRATILLVCFVFFVNLLIQRPLLDSILFSLALAVGLTPEMLPLIVTLNLTRGSLAMVRHGVIVKQLSAVQNFGNMDILCTDKTGTLTEDKITLVKYVDATGAQNELVLKYGYLLSEFSTGFDNPLDTAVKEFRHLSTSEYEKVAELPFTFERKRELVIISEKKTQQQLLLVKGAPEQVLDLAHSYSDQRPLSGEKQRQILELYQQLSADGFRVLAVATKRLTAISPAVSIEAMTELEEKLNFEGFLAFLDPAKKSVMKTIEKMSQLGIQIKVISGDNEFVTTKIAKDIQLPILGVLNGLEIQTLSRQQLAKKVELTTLFCRITPEQKMQIIQALQDNGHVVGYLGDGINDAPSLRAADVGVSVNNAVDVAKDAADLILLRKNLHELIEGVLEGRKTFIHTLKYLRMTLSSNFGNMFSMAAASAFLPFLPLTAPQILFNNLLYDSSQFAIPFDTVDVEDIQKPQRFSIKSLRHFMWQFGLLSSVFDFATFGVFIIFFKVNQATFQSGWFLESILTQTLVVFVIRTRLLPFVKSWPSWQLLVSVGIVLFIAFLVVISPLAHIFAFGTITWSLVAGIVIIAAVYLGLAELLKRRLNKL